MNHGPLSFTTNAPTTSLDTYGTYTIALRAERVLTLSPPCQVFIIQLEGCKKWKLYRPTHPLPRSSSRDLQPTEIGRPSHEITLNVGHFHLSSPFNQLLHAIPPSFSLSLSLIKSANFSVLRQAEPLSLSFFSLSGGRCTLFPQRNNPPGVHTILNPSLHTHHHQHLPAAVSPAHKLGRPIRGLTRIVLLSIQYVGRPVGRCIQLRPRAAHVYTTRL